MVKPIYCNLLLIFSCLIYEAYGGHHTVRHIRLPSRVIHNNIRSHDSSSSSTTVNDAEENTVKLESAAQPSSLRISKKSFNSNNALGYDRHHGSVQDNKSSNYSGPYDLSSSSTTANVAGDDTAAQSSSLHLLRKSFSSNDALGYDRDHRSGQDNKSQHSMNCKQKQNYMDSNDLNNGQMNNDMISSFSNNKSLSGLDNRNDQIDTTLYDTSIQNRKNSMTFEGLNKKSLSGLNNRNMQNDNTSENQNTGERQNSIISNFQDFPNIRQTIINPLVSQLGSLRQNSLPSSLNEDDSQRISDGNENSSITNMMNSNKNTFDDRGQKIVSMSLTQCCINDKCRVLKEGEKCDFEDYSKNMKNTKQQNGDNDFTMSKLINGELISSKLSSFKRFGDSFNEDSNNQEIEKPKNSVFVTSSNRDNDFTMSNLMDGKLKPFKLSSLNRFGDSFNEDSNSKETEKPKNSIFVTSSNGDNDFIMSKLMDGKLKPFKLSSLNRFGDSFNDDSNSQETEKPKNIGLGSTGYSNIFSTFSSSNGMGMLNKGMPRMGSSITMPEKIKPNYPYSKPIGVSEDEVSEIRNEVLQKSNFYRNKFELIPFTLDDQLNNCAQDWANNMAKKQSFDPRPDNVYGENLYKNQDLKNLGESAVDSWYNEMAMFTIGDEDNFDTFYMTQLLWKKSTKLGVGISQSPENGMFYLVADYDPKGNLLEHFKENLPEITEKNIEEAKEADKRLKPKLSKSVVKSLSSSSSISFGSGWHYGSYLKTNYLYSAPIGLSEVEANEIRNEVLQKSNFYRKKFELKPFILDDQLNNCAQDWANNMAKKQSFDPRPDNVYGENLYKNQDLKNLGESAVDSWYNEMAMFTIGDEDNFDTFYMTQLLWKKSTKLGVGISQSPENGMFYLVADYDPKGNLLEHFKENLPEITEKNIEEAKEADKRLKPKLSKSVVKSLSSSSSISFGSGWHYGSYLKTNYLYSAPIGLSEVEANEIRNEVLQKSNFYRKKFELKPFILDDQLNNCAQDWANNMAKKQSFDPRPDNVYGENLYKNQDLKNLGESAVDSWYNEMAMFTIGDEDNFDTFYMTQLLWKKSTKLGVGISQSPENGMFYLVADYDPKGNLLEHFKENLPEITEKNIEEAKEADKRLKPKLSKSVVKSLSSSSSISFGSGWHYGSYLKTNYLYSAPIGLSEVEANEIRNEVLQKSNFYRKKFELKPFILDDQLNNCAQDWANNMAKKQSFDPRPDNVYGENLYKNQDLKNLGESAVDSWYNEMAMFTIGDEDNFDTFYMTQLLWKKSTKLGVGISQSPENGMFYLVADYDPKGNLLEHFKENLPEITEKNIEEAKEADKRLKPKLSKSVVKSLSSSSSISFGSGWHYGSYLKTNYLYSAPIGLSEVEANEIRNEVLQKSNFYRKKFELKPFILDDQLNNCAQDWANNMAKKQSFDPRPDNVYGENLYKNQDLKNLGESAVDSWYNEMAMFTIGDEDNFDTFYMTQLLWKKSTKLGVGISQSPENGMFYLVADYDPKGNLLEHFKENLPEITEKNIEEAKEADKRLKPKLSKSVVKSLSSSSSISFGSGWHYGSYLKTNYLYSAPIGLSEVEANEIRNEVLQKSNFYRKKFELKPFILDDQLNNCAQDWANNMAKKQSFDPRPDNVYGENLYKNQDLKNLGESAVDSWYNEMAMFTIGDEDNFDTFYMTQLLWKKSTKLGVGISQSPENGMFYLVADYDPKGNLLEHFKENLPEITEKNIEEAKEADKRLKPKLSKSVVKSLSSSSSISFGSGWHYGSYLKTNYLYSAPIGLSEVEANEIRNEVLQKSNFYRKKFELKPFILDDQLNNCAQDWANNMAKKQSFDPRPDNVYGENLYKNQDLKNLGESAVDSWYNEMAMFTIGDEDNFDTFYMTQLLWKKSTKLGVGISQSPENGMFYLVADYDPKGNLLEHFKENLPEITEKNIEEAKEADKRLKPKLSKSVVKSLSSSSSISFGSGWHYGSYLKTNYLYSAPIGLSEVEANEIRNEVLQKSNFYRKKFELKPFILDDQLNNCAQDWANNMAKKQSFDPRPDNVYGENLYKNQDLKNLGESAVDSWYNEMAMFTIGDEDNFDTFYMTQLLWKKSTKLGVGISQSPENGMFYLVADYDPKGNLLEHFKENLPEITEKNIEEAKEADKRLKPKLSKSVVKSLSSSSSISFGSGWHYGSYLKTNYLYSAPIGLSEVEANEIRNEVLQKSNFYRKKFELKPFILDDQLNNCAQDWANNMAKKQSFDPRPDNVYGENLYKNQDLKNLGESAVDSWYNEMAMFTIGDEDNFDTFYMTQLLWKKSTKLGVGISQSPENGMFYLVADYDPKGNLLEHFKENLPEITEKNIEEAKEADKRLKPKLSKSVVKSLSSSSSISFGSGWHYGSYLKTNYLYSAPIGLSEVEANEIRNEVLQKSNFYRKKFELKPFILDDQLNNCAQDWANNMAKKQSFDPRPDNVYGENLYKNQDLKNLGESAVDSWYNEMAMFTIGDEDNFDTFYMTQLLWKKSTKLGVGISQSPENGMFYLVADYDPKGNLLEHFKENLPEITEKNIEEAKEADKRLKPKLSKSVVKSLSSSSSISFGSGWHYGSYLKTNYLYSAPIGLSEVEANEIRNEVLQKSNFYRKKFELKPFILDDQLNNCAQDWANNMAKKQSFDPRPDNVYGENLYKNQDLKNLGESAVDSWYNEMAMFTIGDEDNFDTFYMTQLLWKKSTKLGVGISQSPENGMFYLVADYDPKGNLLEHFKENLPEITEKNIEEAKEADKRLKAKSAKSVAKSLSSSSSISFGSGWHNYGSYFN